METRQLMRMLIGATIITLIVIAIAALMPSKAKADSTQVDQKVTELGTAMKGWAIAFGAGLEKNATESKTAFLNDIDKIKNSKFVQDTIEFQKKSWAQSKDDFAKTQESIKTLPDRLVAIPGEIATGVGNFINAITGGKNNDGKNQK